MEEKDKLDIHQLIRLIPGWINDGGLVEVDLGSKKEFGIIVEYCLIEPADLADEEYKFMIENNEWLIIYVCTQSGISDYYLDEIVQITSKE